MNKSEEYILWFDQLSIDDVPLVGGKNAALGEMYTGLVQKGIAVPNGFAITAHAYRTLLRESGMEEKISKALAGLDTVDMRNLAARGKAVRKLILAARLPQALAAAIVKAYGDLSGGEKDGVDVAVRSSATAEDLPDASFAGQQETYLNVRGESDVLARVKECIASLFTNRAISYRVDKGFSHTDAALSVGVQAMVRSDIGASGVMFTIDTESGFDKVAVINGSYGLGEMVVQGKVTPDEFTVFKPLLQEGNARPIIGKALGKKDVKMIYGASGTRIVSVLKDDGERFCLTDDEVLLLARWGLQIEEYFSEKRGRFQPMDIEWAKDGRTGGLFIVQARPETVHASRDKNVYQEYRLLEHTEPLLQGAAIGAKIATGLVRVIKSVKQIGAFKKGEVLVTEITDPDWEPIMKIAAAIITDKGGRTSHAAIVSRELGIPAIVGCGTATKLLKNGSAVTVDCSSGAIGAVYKGALKFSTEEHRLDRVSETRTKVMVNIGAPEEAFRNHWLPVKGVGLGRLEFIIGSYIQIHPNALMQFDELTHAKDPQTRRVVRAIEEKIGKVANKKQYYIDTLAEGIAKIAAAFHPHEVIIRFSDFKTNEYRTLLGGDLFEPVESNPMLGWRGASRYYDPKFKDAFGLECAAIKKVREEIGLRNVVPMVPFCRTPEEGNKVLEIMKAHGLDRGADHSLKIYVMCEIPSNVLQADAFLDIFDGMSIGSNDLTQLTLGVDRDAGPLQHIGNENDAAVKALIAQAITSCRRKGKYVGICGQAPSDFPDFIRFLVEQRIESISLNPDTVIKTLSVIAEAEERR